MSWRSPDDVGPLDTHRWSGIVSGAVDAKRSGKWAKRHTADGTQVRLSVWVREELAIKFDEIVARKQLDKSDVLRSAIEAFVALDEEERNGRNRKDRLLAQRIFRILIGVIGPKEILSDVLKLMTKREADRVIEKIRSERTNG